MKKLLSVFVFTFLTVTCLHLAFVNTAEADAVIVIIDDFQAGDYLLGRTGTPPYTVSSTQFDGSGTHILGGQRDVTFQKLTGSELQPYVNVLSTVTYAGYTGISTFNSSFNCNALWTMTYGLAGDLNADLIVGGLADHISVTIEGDQDNSVPVRPIPMTITVVSGTGTATITKNMVEDGTHAFYFTEFAGVDFADVDRITFEIEQDSQLNDAVDFAIFQFYAGAGSVPVEETSWGRVKALYGQD